MPIKPVIHGVKTLAQTKLFHVEAVDLEFSNGTQCQFERVNNATDGMVMVIPILNDELILIREYAVGSEEYELGFVKGLIDPGESPETAANRELTEEIGFGSTSLKHIRKIRLAPHYNTAVGHIFLATDLYPESSLGDEPEEMEQVRWSLNDIQSLFDHPQISDVRTLYSLFWLQNNLKSI